MNLQHEGTALKTFIKLRPETITEICTGLSMPRSTLYYCYKKEHIDNDLKFALAKYFDVSVVELLNPITAPGTAENSPMSYAPLPILFTDTKEKATALYEALKRAANDSTKAIPTNVYYLLNSGIFMYYNIEVRQDIIKHLLASDKLQLGAVGTHEGEAAIIYNIGQAQG